MLDWRTLLLYVHLLGGGWFAWGGRSARVFVRLQCRGRSPIYLKWGCGQATRKCSATVVLYVHEPDGRDSSGNQH